MNKLGISILTSLLEGRKRPCEIRKRLSSTYHYDDDRVFDVIISRKLKKLREEGLVDRTENKRQNVSYAITSKGKRRLFLGYPKEILQKLQKLPKGSIQIEVLRFLTYLKILLVESLTPDGAPPDKYIENLRNAINDNNLPAQFRELLNDPGKGYLEFNKYLEQYQKKRVQIAAARLKVEGQ